MRCMCGHDEAWHIGRFAGGRWTQERVCAVEGCGCTEYRREG